MKIFRPTNGITSHEHTSKHYNVNFVYKMYVNINAKLLVNDVTYKDVICISQVQAKTGGIGFPCPPGIIWFAPPYMYIHY